MRTIGLIGGMSWESTVPYYETINRIVGERLGGLHSAKILLASVEFAEIVEHQHAGRWDACAEILARSARALEGGGADFLVICTNTMHKVAPQIERAVSISILHIADATAERIRRAGLHTVGLLGTRFTTEQDFYRGRLEERHGLEILVPSEADREVVHRVIYDELCHGRLLDESRSRFRRIVSSLVERGAQGVILGCTEIGLLLHAGDSPVPLFDTTAIHAEAAALHALAVGGMRVAGGREQE